jgi:hypothetical protein
MVLSSTKKCVSGGDSRISHTLQIVPSSFLSHGRDGSLMHLVGGGDDHGIGESEGAGDIGAYDLSKTIVLEPQPY